MFVPVGVCAWVRVRVSERACGCVSVCACVQQIRDAGVARLCLCLHPCVRMHGWVDMRRESVPNSYAKNFANEFCKKISYRFKILTNI